MINVDYLVQGIVALSLLCILYYLDRKLEDRSYISVISLITVFSGLSFVLMPNKISPLFGMSLLLIGTYFYSNNWMSLELSFSKFDKIPGAQFFGFIVIIGYTVFNLFFVHS